MNNIYDMARDLRQYVRDYLRDQLSTLIKVLPYSNSTASGEQDKLQGYPTEGTDEQKYDYDGRRLQPFGIRSRPPAGVYGVWVGARSNSGNGVILSGDSTRFGPSGLADGDVSLYCKQSGVAVDLKASDGSVTITDKSGNKFQADGTNINITATANANVNISASGTGAVSISSTAVTGAVKLGPVGNLAVLVQGTFDSLGVPVTQNPAATLTIVKAG